MATRRRRSAISAAAAFRIRARRSTNGARSSPSTTIIASQARSARSSNAARVSRMSRRRNKLHRPVGDLLLTMRERADTLSQGQQQVAAAMLADPDFAVRANVDALARRAKVSPPTIVRFSRALGFAGLRDFKLHLAQSLAVGTSTLHRAVEPGADIQTVTSEVLQGAASALANLEQHIAPEDIERAVTRIAKARRGACVPVADPPR